MRIGVDLVEIKRIQRLSVDFPEKFAARILTVDELFEYSTHKKKIHFLAKRFAVKEATSKALGCGIGEKVGFWDIFLAHTAEGRPLLQLSPRASQFAASLGLLHWEISLSDTEHYATATVLFW